MARFYPAPQHRNFSLPGPEYSNYGTPDYAHLDIDAELGGHNLTVKSARVCMTLSYSGGINKISMRFRNLYTGDSYAGAYFACICKRGINRRERHGNEGRRGVVMPRVMYEAVS